MESLLLLESLDRDIILTLSRQTPQGEIPFFNDLFLYQSSPLHNVGRLVIVISIMYIISIFKCQDNCDQQIEPPPNHQNELG